MKRIICFVLFAIIYTQPLFSYESKSIDTALAKMPKPWKTKVHRPNLEEYTETMNYWAQKYADICTIETVGKSNNDLPIYLVKITDPKVSDDNKYCIIVTGFHAGAERNGGTANLAFIEWMFSDDPLAKRARETHIVLVMPIVNPYGFFVKEQSGNVNGIDVYSAGRGKVWDIANIKLKDPNKAPEIVAVMNVMDKYAPAVQVDQHGIALHYNGQLTVGAIGGAYSNFALRPWDQNVNNAMFKSGQAAGYGYDRIEMTAQRLLYGDQFKPIDEYFWYGRPYFYTAMYSYVRNHTMPTTTEICWEQSGVEAIKGLIKYGIDSKGPLAGYPVNVIKRSGMGELCSGGQTPGVRRKSRVELWRRQAAVAFGGLYPQTDFREMFICSTSFKGLEILTKGTGESGRWGKIYKEPLLKNLAEFDYIDVEPIKKFIEAGPESQNRVLYERGKVGANIPATPVENGLSIVARIPYPEPTILDIRLNGKTITENPVDGYQRWYEDGYTKLRINVTPEMAKRCEIYVITIAYDTKTKRSYGWKTPPEVIERLKAKSKSAN